jgi:osmotically inducible protein OsmC
MSLAAGLARAGFSPVRIHTTAAVRLGKVGEAFRITHVELTTEADVPGIEEAAFQEEAAAAKRNCPVSRALAGVEISLEATLSSA